GGGGAGGGCGGWGSAGESAGRGGRPRGKESGRGGGGRGGLAAVLGNKIEPYRHRHFGGGGRRRRAAVAGMIDQRGVSLVAHCRNQRGRRERGGAHDDLLVERHQILQAAAAAADGDQPLPWHGAGFR